MIQTRGFDVQNMPRFTPVDPELVALNPNRATTGILDTLKIADALKRQKAFQALQDELDATREARINAQNVGSNVAVAQGNKTIRQLPRIEGIENLQFANQETTLPLQGDLGLAQISSQLATLPSSTQAAIAGNIANKGLSDIQIATQPARLSLADIETKGAVSRSAETEALKDDQVKASRIAQDYANKVNEKTYWNTINELNDKLSAASTAQERAQALEKAKLDLIKAQATEAKAHADYFDAGGAATRQPDPVSQLQKLSAVENSHLNEMTRLLNTTVPSPTGKGEKITLSQYLSMTRENGTDAPAKKGLIFKTEVPRIPEAENLVSQLKTVVDRAKRAREMTDKLSLTINFGEEARSSASIKSFATEQEAQAAEDAGTLKIGDEITIGGVKGKWTK